MAAERYDLQFLGLALAVVGCFMFLLGLFTGGILPYQTDELWFWPLEIWTAPIIFYSGIGLVILGTVLLSTVGSMTAEKEMDLANRIENQSLSKKTRLRHFPIDIGIALIAGVVAAAVNNFVAWAPSLGSHGFPFTVTIVTPGCFGPAGSIGCVTYYPLAIGLDGAFWACLALVMVAVVDFVTTVHARPRLASVTVRKIRS